jgi:hypothetical protein
VRLDLGTDHLKTYIARRAKKIAKAEGLDGKPIQEYVKLVEKHKCNLRAVLQEVESGAML